MDQTATIPISCSELIEKLTDADRAHLLHFAESRLAYFRIPSCHAEDARQQAFYAILSGGRHPNPSDLTSQKAFINYLRGVINSVIEGWRRPCHKNPTESIEDFHEVLTSPQSESIEFRDFKAQLFPRLRERAPARLRPTIDAWAQDPHGRIPRVTCRKHVAAVRKLAQQISEELGYARPKRKEPPGGESSGSDGFPHAATTAGSDDAGG